MKSSLNKKASFSIKNQFGNLRCSISTGKHEGVSYVTKVKRHETGYEYSCYEQQICNDKRFTCVVYRNVFFQSAKILLLQLYGDVVLSCSLKASAPKQHKAFFLFW